MTYVIGESCVDVLDRACVDECPVQAIFPQEDLPAEWASFIEKNAEYYKK